MYIYIGWPASEVVWWRDEKRIDSSWEQISPGKSRYTRLYKQETNLTKKLKCIFKMYEIENLVLFSIVNNYSVTRANVNHRII